LTSTLDGREWSDSRPCRFTPSRQKSAGIHWIGGWVGLRVGMGALVKKKILPLPGMEPGSSSTYHVPEKHTLLFINEPIWYIFFISLILIFFSKIVNKCLILSPAMPALM
jgi:hypothetical protein